MAGPEAEHDVPHADRSGFRPRRRTRRAPARARRRRDAGAAAGRPGPARPVRGAGWPSAPGWPPRCCTAATARRTVPAYRAATAGRHDHGRPRRRAGRLPGYLQALPVLDKASYIDRYPVAAALPRRPAARPRGVEVDESSGSSGRPYQWVRSRAELDQVERGLAVQARWLLRVPRAPPRRGAQLLLDGRLGHRRVGDRGAAPAGRDQVLRTGRRTRRWPRSSCSAPDVCYVVCGYPPFLAALPRRRRGRGRRPVRPTSCGGSSAARG